MVIEWLYAADKVIEEVRGLDVYKELKNIRIEINKNSELKILRNFYLRAKQKYKEALKYGEYYPDFNQIKSDYINAKVNFMEHPLIKKEILLNKKIQKILDEISVVIGKSVSDKVKVPNELGIIKRH